MLVWRIIIQSTALVFRRRSLSLMAQKDIRSFFGAAPSAAKKSDTNTLLTTSSDQSQQKVAAAVKSAELKSVASTKQSVDNSKSCTVSESPKKQLNRRGFTSPKKNEVTVSAYESNSSPEVAVRVTRTASKRNRVVIASESESGTELEKTNNNPVGGPRKRARRDSSDIETHSKKRKTSISQSDKSDVELEPKPVEQTVEPIVERKRAAAKKQTNQSSASPKSKKTNKAKGKKVTKAEQKTTTKEKTPTKSESVKEEISDASVPESPAHAQASEDAFKKLMKAGSGKKQSEKPSDTAKATTSTTSTSTSVPLRILYGMLAEAFEQIEATSSRLKITSILAELFGRVIDSDALKAKESNASGPGKRDEPDLLACVYLCLNRVAPEYDGIELGVGDHILLKALANATGRKEAQLKTELQRVGDLGRVAQTSKSTQTRITDMFKQRPSASASMQSLTIANVFNMLREVAASSGTHSSTRKTELIQGALAKATQVEAKYLVRSLSGKLRIGLAEQTVLAALGAALADAQNRFSADGDGSDASGKASKRAKPLDAAEATRLVKTAYAECPNYERLLAAATDWAAGGVRYLPLACSLTPGVPLKPMLAHPTKAMDEVFKRFETSAFVGEYKYDGERCQIHFLSTTTEEKPANEPAKAASPESAALPEGEVELQTTSNTRYIVKIFSRNQEDNTTKYPDLVARIEKAIKWDSFKDSDGESREKGAMSFIMDCEAVAYDVAKNEILPFQVLSTRKRKDAKADEIKVQVCVYGFDLLFLDGRSLIREPYRERRTLLRRHFHEVPGEFEFVRDRLFESPEKEASDSRVNTEQLVSEFLDIAIAGNCEGLMLKTLDDHATYEISKRSHSWLKLKKDYLDGIGDTLDLVVIGGYYGTGKRTGRLGAFLLACVAPEDDSDDEDDDDEADGYEPRYQAICKLGTGFSDEQLVTFSEELNKLRVDKPSSMFEFDKQTPADVWFKPQVVWEVKAADLSLSPNYFAAMGLVDAERGISLRFPRFVRLRDDKRARDATRGHQVATMYRAQFDKVKSTKRRIAPKNADGDLEDEDNELESDKEVPPGRRSTSRERSRSRSASRSRSVSPAAKSPTA